MDVIKKQLHNTDFSACSNDYELGDTLGSGAYGIVCCATDKRTQTKIAIKKITNLNNHVEIARRTLREMKILRYFKHDNITSIRKLIMEEVKEKSFDVYIILDFMETDLHKIIHSSQSLTVEHSKYFLFQILSALKYIHSANVLHRDLKPSNILVNKNCQLRICDFGLARGLHMENLERNSTDSQNKFLMTQYVATRWYRAPEILLGVTDYTFSIDLWSVGCILGEMMKRKQLFPGISLIDQLRRIFLVVGLPPESLFERSKSKDLFKTIKENFNLPNTINKSLRDEIQQSDVDKNAFDILVNLLKTDPADRPSASTALQHPFLAGYFEGNDPPCYPPFDFSFDRESSNKEEVLEAIRNEVKSYQSRKFNFVPVDQGNDFKKPSTPPQIIKPVEKLSSEDIYMVSPIGGEKAGFKKVVLVEDDDEENSVDLIVSDDKDNNNDQSNDINKDLNLNVNATNVDPKLLLKNALLKKIQNKNDNCKVDKKKKTARDKMLERQAKREIRKKKQLQRKKDIKKLCLKSNTKDINYTPDDLQMLNRWKSMHNSKAAPILQQEQNTTFNINNNNSNINNSTDLQMNILADNTKHLHLETFNLDSNTPKGSAEGYGIGMDLDALLNVDSNAIKNHKLSNSPHDMLTGEEVRKLLNLDLL